ncbi:Ubiquitin-40S ribosomal protein S27a [Thelohanellus kitauei]|uniref:Ubiquitin-40S ribosomal protein S27a n=1 Tax=Thelohanellus kitauei TaxID=669202 RepID=A0A0C2MGC2_THEKT|nr:Ubiquitin-40S ribosomal protein S27a [Thelohanellus kitauei]
MQIFVRTTCGKTVLVEIKPETTVESLKQELIERGDISPKDDLIYGDRLLNSSHDLVSSKMERYSTLFVTSGLDGGAKKRKKKSYSTPKKIKHKLKKVKLRILKYYSVQKDGVVKRLRSSCPKCGPGVFLANHHDRLYCGRCCESTRKTI